MGIFSRKKDRRRLEESQRRGAAMDRFIAEGDAAITESENEHKARKANEKST